MGWSGRKGKPRPLRISRRVAYLLILAGILLMLLWLGLTAYRAYQFARGGLAHMETLQASLQRPAPELLADFSALKEQVDALDSDLQALRAEVGTFDWLLGNLGWVPRYGPELAATPHITAMAADLSGAAADLGTVLEALLPALQEGSQSGLPQIVTLLQQQRALLLRAHGRLQHAAYERTFIDARQLDDGPFGRIASLLEQLDANLPALVQDLGLLNKVLPQADTLLGMQGPRRYLILGQNNFELRATGGFLGSMGVVTLDQGEITQLDYRRSYDWDNPNREKVQPPFPYVRYMLFGAWFIRDANFYSDFPTSAQTVQMFWKLDGHEPAGGVIAVDLYAIQALLEALGPVEVPGYGVSVGGANMLETIWEGYRRDPGFLPAMTAAVAQRLQQPGLLTTASLPALAQALGGALEEKHILLYFDDPALQGVVLEAGWGGAIRSDRGDFLMVVDSDFSYAEVNRFIEQDIAYQVTLDRSLQVQESTVTLSYWNHFDRWGSAETRELFGGFCFDPQTKAHRHDPGCYGDYIRIYVPEGSRFVRAEGFDDGMEYRQEAGRTCIAGYLRVLPGEQRTVSVTYVPPAVAVGGEYRLTLQKQPGTDALPVDVQVQVAASPVASAGMRTDLRVDRTITAQWQSEQLVLSTTGPQQAQLDPQRRARQQAFAEGLALWHAGQQDQAVARWRDAAAADLVLDQANLLLSRGELTAAAELCQAALRVAPDSARAHFLLGKVHIERGDTAAARQALGKAVELEPANYAAQLELGLLYEAQGDVEQAYAHLRHADPREANHQLWARAWPYFNSGQPEAGLAALELIIRLDPADANALFVRADQLRALKRYDQALVAYDELHRAAPGDVRYYLGRGQLHADQGQGDAAIADLETAVNAAPASAEAWFHLGRYRWRFRRDGPGATAALARALALSPNAWYATELGNVYRDSGDWDAATRAYEQATALHGSTAYTWELLGSAYTAQERWDDAARAYAAAIALDPQNARLHAALAAAHEKAGRKTEAIAAYEAALALEPGNAQWLAAVERLKQ